jgi:hypothetical protein
MAHGWYKKLSGLTAKMRALLNTVKRTGQSDTYKETITSDNKKIRKAKRSSWRRYYQISDVLGSARLMKIMAKQETNRVSTTKLPDGRH